MSDNWTPPPPPKTKKKTVDMKVTVIPILVGALGMFSKDLEKDRRNWKSEELRLSRPQQY